jgi:RNA polymerase sigma-70 factor (ECF subfamily)
MDAVMPGLKAARPPLALPIPLATGSFEDIYEAHKAAVFRLACSLTDNTRDAEDLFQETWLRAVRAGRGGRPTGEVKSWLFMIAANLHRDGLRRKRIRRLFFLERAREMVEDAADADTGWEAGRFSARDFAVRAEFGLCLRRAMCRLPTRQREVFVLKDIEGYKHDEISRMLSIPEVTVRTLLHRAVKNLQKELAAFAPGEGRGGAREESRP